VTNFSIYRVLAIFSAVIFLVDSFLNGAIASYMVVDAEMLTNKMQLWRFATYPFIYGNIANAFIGFVALYYLAPQIKKQLNKGVFDFSFSFAVFFIGMVLFMLNFNSPKTPVFGIEALSAFVLSLYALFNRQKDKRFFKSIRLNRTAFPIFILVGWSALYLLGTGAMGINSDIISPSPAMLGIGFLTGFLGYFILKNETKEFDLNRFQVYKMPERRDLEPTPALIDTYKSMEMQKPQPQEELITFSEEDPEQNEEILNDILDKINALGFKSLTEEEKEFLHIYAKSK
jgi:membrane associated rhomboid family serine protease